MSPRGGTRHGAGKPLSRDGPYIRRSILLPRHLWDFLKSIGDGNVSAGARKAINTIWTKSTKRAK